MVGGIVCDGAVLGHEPLEEFVEPRQRQEYRDDRGDPEPVLVVGLAQDLALMRLSTALVVLAASRDRLVAWAGRNEATWVSISSRSTVTSS